MLEAFKVGIVIALTNRASGVLGIIARDFAKTDANAVRLRNTLKSVSLLTVGGGALMGAGLLGLRGIETWMDAATRYEQAFARFRGLNLGQAVNRDADHFAQSARLIGVTATDLMTTVTDLHTVFGNYNHARALAPFVARMEFANKAVFGDATRFNSAQALSMGKVIEMRGGFKSEAEMKNQIDFMQKVMSGTGGRVMPQDYLSFLKTSGVAGRLQANPTFYFQMEPLIQEMGGLRVGTSLMSAYQNIAQGRTTVRTVRELMRLGLVNPHMVEFNSLGQLNRIKPGGVKGGDMVASDPLAFMRTVLLPAFAQHGITSEKGILNEIGTLFTNRTAASMMSLIYLQAAKIDKNIGVDRRAMGVNGLLALGQNTPMGAKIRAEASWENLKTQLGLKVIPIVLPMILGLADGIQRLASAAQRHPTLTKWLVYTAMGLSAIAVVVGGIAVVAGGIMLVAAALGGGIAAGTALAIAGITAVVIALGAGVIAAWPKIKSGFNAVGEAIFGFFGWLGNLAKRGWHALVSTPAQNFRNSLRSAMGLDENGKATRSAFYRGGAHPGAMAGAVTVNKVDLANAVKDALNGTSVQMDGQSVGRIVTNHQGNAASKPSTGPGVFDPRLAPFQPSFAIGAPT